MTFYIYDVKNP